MSAIAASSILAARYAQLKQTRPGTTTDFTSLPVRIYKPQVTSLIVRPMAKEWSEIQNILAKVVNLPGFMESRVKELFDQGYGSELETAAEIALATAKKSPFHLFTAMISKKSGNWTRKTLKIVHETWEVRQNALTVLEQLKLPVTSVRAVLALAWRLKESIMRYLGIATEKGTGIKNPAGVFFALTKKRATE